MADRGLLTKTEAANVLGLSERAVARHAAAGRLGHPEYHPLPGGGSRVYYSAESVEQLKASLAAGTGSDVAIEGTQRGRALRTVHAPGPIPDQWAVVLAEAIASAIGKARETEIARVPLDRKLTLTIAEAADLSGLPKAHIKRAVRGKKLRAVKVGGQWRIERGRLRAYVRALR